MDFLRTPDSRFDHLEGYPFAPHYRDITAPGTPSLRMHYVDEGPRDGKPVLLPMRWSALKANSRWLAVAIR